MHLLEQYNELKWKLQECLKAIPSTPENSTDDYSVEEITKVVLHGFESSQIFYILEQFITKTPIPESIETKQLLERFAINYPYLELYRGCALQGTIIIDYALSFLSNFDISLNILTMLAKCWDKDESIDLWQNRIGYYGFIRQTLSTLSHYNAYREGEIDITELLATQLYAFNVPDLSLKLQQEETFNRQKKLPLSALSTRSGLIDNIAHFEVFSQKNENLLQNVFAYSMNMHRLINLKNPFQMDLNRTCLQEILEIDLFSLIGDIMFDENSNVSLRDIEAIVCNLNTNLIHVITKNTCPVISICDKFSLNLNDELNELLHLLNKTDNDAEISGSMKQPRKPFKIKRHDILYYVQQHNELIAYLLKRIHDIELQQLDEEPKMELNCSLLNNIMQMDELNVPTVSKGPGDRMIAALNFDSFNLDIAREYIHQKKYR